MPHAVLAAGCLRGLVPETAAAAHRSLDLVDRVLNAVQAIDDGVVRFADVILQPIQPLFQRAVAAREPATFVPLRPLQLGDALGRDDWGDVPTLWAHKAARDDLEALLAQWEQLFEAAQSS